jgi:hypothetical protein
MFRGVFYMRPVYVAQKDDSWQLIFGCWRGKM